MELSVIIPTRDRADWLEGCLRTIVHQVRDVGGEVIVVDDGSVDATGEVAASYGVRCVAQQPSGLNVARNRGAQEAKGRILAYVDDDIYAADSWASALLRSFEETGCDAVGGKVILKFEAPKPRWLRPKLYIQLSGQDFGDERRPMAINEIPIGANCAVTREAFDALGGFREGFDREGTSLLSNGDKEFFLRLHQAGFTIMYEPSVSVLHRVPPARMQKRWFRKRLWWQGVSDAILPFDPGIGPRRSKPFQAARELLRLTRTVPILISNLITGQGVLAAELWFIYCAGRLAGLRRAK